MKKLLMLLPLITLVFVATSCKKDITAEKPFIELGNGDEGRKSTNPYWDWADKFPGPVSFDLPRVADFEVTVKGGYKPLGFAPDSAVLQSTGLYAASDQPIEIVVPEGTTDLWYQIGMGHTLPDGQLLKRYKSVVLRGRLSPGVNSVPVYFSGFLYLLYPADRIAPTDITVKVTGAVQSDDFIYGQTEEREWIARMLERSEVLLRNSEDKDSTAFLNWCEIRSDKVVYQMGIPEMAAMTSPNSILDNMGAVVDGYRRFAGIDPAGQPPMRVYTDIQLPDSKQTAGVPGINVRYYGGYPIGYLRGETFTTTENEKHVINPYLLKAQTDDTYGNWLQLMYGFGEAVHGPWQKSPLLWTPSLEIGCYYFARTLDLWPGKVINFASYVEDLNKYYDPVKSNNGNGDLYTALSNDARTTMFMQLVHHLGWELFPYVSTRAREMGFTYVDDPLLSGQAACDFFCMSACEYANENLLPFFKKWNFPVTASAAGYMKQFPDLISNFWESYDRAFIPTFDTRTPNKSFTRPQGVLNYTSYDSKKEGDGDEYEGWYMEGILWEYGYPDTQNVAQTGNSKDEPSWRNAFDNNGGTYSGFFGRLAPDGSSECKVPEFTLTVSDNPIPINTLALWQKGDYYRNNYFYDIRYWDDANGEWKSALPQSIKTVWVAAYEYYHFEESFTTTKINFKLQACVGETTYQGKIVTIVQIPELSVGYTEYK